MKVHPVHQMKKVILSAFVTLVTAYPPVSLAQAASLSSDEKQTVALYQGCAQGYVFATVQDSIERSVAIDERRLVGFVLFACANTRYMKVISKGMRKGRALDQLSATEVEELKNIAREDMTQRVLHHIEDGKPYYSAPNSPTKR